MSGKPPKRPYSSSRAPNGRGEGRGTVHTAAEPNLPEEAFHNRTLKNTYFNAERAPRNRSIRALVSNLLRRQRLLSRKTGRRGAIHTIPAENRRRLKSRSPPPPNHIAINVRPLENTAGVRSRSRGRSRNHSKSK